MSIRCLIVAVGFFSFLFTLGLTEPSYAQRKIGLEFQINTFTDDDQEGLTVSELSSGGFVVTWESDDQDGSDNGIYAQVYDKSGIKIGGEFQVNTYTVYDQEDPAIAGLSSGGFVIAWESFDQDGSDDGIYAQRFDSSGAKVGSEFQVNTYTDNPQRDPTAAGLSNDGFIILWESSSKDREEIDIFAQMFDSSGAKVGSEFQINTDMTGSKSGPSVAGLSDGDFIVIWASQDGSGKGVYAQRFDSSGAKVGSEFQVNTNTIDNQGDPDVTGVSDGGFVVTWKSADQDGSGGGVYAQRFDSSSAKVGRELPINTYIVGLQGDPTITGLSVGGFVVTWKSVGQREKGSDIYAQIYNGLGERIYGEFQVNNHTEKNQADPEVAGLTEGEFVIIWKSKSQDGSGYGVFGQIFTIVGEAPSSYEWVIVIFLIIVVLAFWAVRQRRTRGPVL